MLLIQCSCIKFIGVKYQYASRAVRAYVHVFWKQSEHALIGACALNKANSVFNNHCSF